MNRYTPYYSDHDALCVAVEKVIKNLKYKNYANSIFQVWIADQWKAPELCETLMNEDRSDSELVNNLV